MEKRNCVTALICAAIFGFFLFQSQFLSDTAAYWPTMICAVGLGLSGLEILLEGLKWRRAVGSQGKLFPLTWEQSKRGLVVLCILVLWVLGLSTVGFLITSLVALCAVAVWFEPIKTRRNLVRDVAVCIVIGILVYVMFGYLGVHFPRALLI